MFPKVTTNQLEMKKYIQNYMDDTCANEWYEGCLNERAFLGSYCNGLMWLRKISFHVILHELTHHFVDLFKNKVNSEKPDIFHYFNEVYNALIQKNYFVFYTAINEIKRIIKNSRIMVYFYRIH